MIRIFTVLFIFFTGCDVVPEHVVHTEDKHLFWHAARLKIFTIAMSDGSG